MTYLELVSAVKNSNPHDLKSDAAAKRVVDSVFAMIKNEAKDGGRVAIPDFGAFALRDARTTGQTPSGEKWTKPATKTLRFVPYKAVGRGAGSDKLIKLVAGGTSETRTA